MRITLLAVNAKYVHTALAPWCLKAGMLQYGVTDECQVIEGNINQPDRLLLEKVMATKPDVVGFCCYIWNMPVIARLCRMVSALLPGAALVLGGPEVSFRPESALNETGANAVLVGPGEYAFACLVKALKGEMPFDQVPGLCGYGVKTLPAPLPKEPPSPYTKELLSSLPGRLAYLETSRGCPFSCAFCLSGREDKVIFYPMERVKREILLLAGTGARTIKLVDRTFNCNPARAREIISYILEKKASGEIQEVCFHFEVGADLFDKETLALLTSAPAGLFQVEAGLQSFHPETLAAVMRKTSLERLEENLRTLIACRRLHVHVDLIAGLPYEDLPTFARSFDRAFALRPDMLQLGFLKLLYGSSLRAQAQQYGIAFSPDPPYEVLKTAWLSFDDLAQLKKTEQALERLYNSGKFPETMALLLPQSGRGAFTLFTLLGQEMAKREGGWSLNLLAELLYNQAAKNGWAGEKEMRDALAFDLLTHDPTGALPHFLRREDGRLKQVAAAWRAALPEGTKTACAMLYSRGQALCVRYDLPPHPVTGQYEYELRAENSQA